MTAGSSPRETIPARLEALAAQARASIASANAKFAQIRAERLDTVADDEHDPEGPTLAYEWSLALAQRRDAEQTLEEVDAARTRLADGTFGRCIDCGRPIARARLEAYPTSARCIDCQERFERAS